MSIHPAQTIALTRTRVVFSSWRLTLNVVAAGLQQAGIQFLRYDGSIAQKTRHETLELFKTDPLTRVLLLTFSCGAVGLTLTEASRAYLLEPHWCVAQISRDPKTTMMITMIQEPHN